MYNFNLFLHQECLKIVFNNYLKMTTKHCIFSSPDPKGQVSYCHHWASGVCRPFVNFSHFNQLLWSHWANLNQTLVEWSLDGPLPKLCLVIPTVNQDGHQAKNRKRGDEILIVHCCFSISQNELKFYMARSSLTCIAGFTVKCFFRWFIQIMQIGHILIKDHI